MSSVSGGSSHRPDRYTLSELEELTGVSGRTIRYYITQGLLTPAYGRGPTATYDQDHLLRVRAILQLKERRLSLKQIKTELEQLTIDNLAMMFNDHRPAEAELWRLHQLHPDFRVMVRDRSGTDRATHDYAFDLILEYARSVLTDLENGVS